MIFFGDVSPAGILELDHPELYSDLLKGKLANLPRAARHRQEVNPTHSSRSAYLFAAVYGARTVYLTAYGEDHRLNI